MAFAAGQPLTSYGSEAGAIELVIAEGVGLDVESARKDSYRNAVRQAVGAYVDAETIVANDELISDKVITLSPAFVERVDPIPGGESREGSLTRVRVRAHVRITKLLDTLAEGKIKTRSHTKNVDTQSLLAELQTKADQSGGQRDVLQRALVEYPQSCMSLQVDGKPSIATSPDGKTYLQVPILLSPNYERYAAFSEQLCTALAVNKRPSGEFAVDGLRFGPNPEWARDRFTGACREALTSHESLLGVFPDRVQDYVKQSCDADGKSPIVSTGPRYAMWDGSDREGLESLAWGVWKKLRENKPKHWIVICMTEQVKNLQRTKWKWFLLSDEEIRGWFNAVPNEVRCRVTLLDKDGGEVASDSLDLKRIGVMTYNKELWLVPFFVQRHNVEWYTPELRLVKAFTVDAEDVAAVATIKANVEPVPVQAR